MRRILSFHGFNFVLLLGIGYTTECICAFTALDSCLVVLLFGYFVVCKSLLQLSLSSFQQEIIRDNHCAQQAPTNPTTHNKNP